jgi:RimJ/RimL family protein N-acetyltransferase
MAINNNEIMEIVKFTRSDFNRLAENIDSPMEMMIWAGPKYQYPLTFEQLEERMSQKARNYLFSLFDGDIKQTIGFIEIEILDEDKRVGSIQSVMIFKDFRGRNYSEELLDLAVKYAFETLKLKRLELKVFSFNKAAISCYKRTGFVEEEIINKIDSKTGKAFQLIAMKKEKEVDTVEK